MRFVLCVVLVAATFLVFSNVLRHGFINLDDDVYILNNRQVQSGLNLASVRWALKAVYAGTWQPLVWISYMVDNQFFGLKPFGYHFTNVLLHIAATLLLFFAFVKMTYSLWRSFFVAAVFGLHPLRIESVAWIAERKDVLSAFFWVLTMLAYAWYVESPSTRRYFAVLAALALGLVAKPMLVTLPFALLLLDYWPLRRFGAAPAKALGNNGVGATRPVNASIKPVIIEKIPMFVLILASAGVAYYSQKVGGAVSSLERIPFGVRIADAFAFYTAYIWKMLWPVKLAVIYPHPGASVPHWQVLSSAVVLITITCLILWRRDIRYLPVGWLWFLGTLVPVIGIVQIGPHGIADRFTYIPMIGVLVIAAWGVPELLARDGKRQRQTRPHVLPIAASIVVLSFAICTWYQVHYWKDNLTLFSRALACTTNNLGIMNNMGLALAEEGRLDEAIQFYKKGLSLTPSDPVLCNNIGLALSDRGKFDEAITYYEKALKVKPSYPEAMSNLGLALYRKGMLNEAEARIKQALRIKPDYATAHQNLALIYAATGRIEEAIRELREAVNLDPNFGEAHYNLAMLLTRIGRVDEAVKHLQAVVRINPDDAVAHYRLGIVYFGRKDFENAIREYEEAVRIQPDMLRARNNLAVALYFAGRYAEAWEQVREIRNRGSDVHPQFLAALSSKMPEGVR